MPGLAGVASISAAALAGPDAATSKTLTFGVVFSLLQLIAANNIRNPHSPIALGDEIAQQDRLFGGSQCVGDDLFSCVIVSAPGRHHGQLHRHLPLPGGDITAQTRPFQGPRRRIWR